MSYKDICNFKTLIGIFEKAVPEKICDEIVKYATSIRDKMAVTGHLQVILKP